MGSARKIEVDTIYCGKNISETINRYMTSFSYEDVASGSSDSVSIGLRDDEKLWINSWYPSKGDSVKSSIIFLNWYSQDSKKILSCGDFQVDDFSYKGRPLTATLKAASVPQNSAFNTEERTKTWESVTLKQIGEEIAARAGISLYYEADSISIKSIEQNSKTDCNFLYSLCQSYGLAMKVYANKIVIYDEEWYENREASIVLDESEMESWSYNTTVAGTYTGATFMFTDPNDEMEYAIDIGGGERILTINVTADSIFDAELKGIAKLNNENKKGTIMSVTIPANPSIVAGINIQISGLGKLDGKYYVDSVRTKISGGGTSTMSLSLHKIIPRIKSVSIRAVEVYAEEKATEGIWYEVQPRDTLWDLAVEFYGKGKGSRYIEIYNANQEIIEKTAKEHGRKSSDNGHWIWPGTMLLIPAK